MGDRQWGISSFGGFGLQRGLGDFDQFGKRSRIGGGEVGQDFAVERDLGGLQAFHEAAVGCAGGAGGGIDADLPEGAESAFLDAAVAEGVGAAVVNGIGGIAVEFGAAHPVAFGGCYHPFAAFAGSGCVSYAHNLVGS